MKIIDVLIGIRDCTSCNSLIFSPMRIGNYNFRISLRPLREVGAGPN